MGYRKALERLEAYEPKALLCDVYAAVSDCCAIGAVVPATRRLGTYGLNVGSAARELPEISAGLDALGMTVNEAQALQGVNDLAPVKSNAERYRYVLKWLRAQVAKETEVQS